VTQLQEISTHILPTVALTKLTFQNVAKDMSRTPTLNC